MFLHRFGRLDQPPAVAGGAEQGGETRIRIKGRPAQPIDRAVAADQRRGLAVADQPVIFDGRGQAFSPESYGRSGRGTLPAAIWPLPSGNRRRQFGCSLTVPGIFGWSITPSRSSSEIASRRDLVR